MNEPIGRTRTPFAVGETGLVIEVPEAEAAVGPCRAKYDIAARFGMPAHVTVLYPWLPSSAVTAKTLDRLSELCAKQVAFDVRFERICRFPGTLWLDPTPTMRFAVLTEAVHRAWPEAPPYRGQFDTVIPHLTVADEQPPDVLDAAERAVERWLPIGSRVATLSLYAFDGQRWRRRRRFPLGGAGGRGTPTR